MFQDLKVATPTATSIPPIIIILPPRTPGAKRGPKPKEKPA